MQSLQEHADGVREAIVGAPGETSSDLRASAMARARGGEGFAAGGEGLVPIVQAFVDAVAHRPRQADVEGLLASVRSEDAVLEITLAAAAGAGFARAEHGLAALRGRR